MSFEHLLGDFDYTLFDVPVGVFPQPVPSPEDLDWLNRELAKVAGYEQTVVGEGGELLPRLRARWGGNEPGFFCENRILKYVHSSKSWTFGWSVYSEQDRRWHGPFPLDRSKWLESMCRVHGDRRGHRLYEKVSKSKVHDLVKGLAIVGRQRYVVEQFVHREVVEPGWEAVRWWRQLDADDVGQRTIEEYNDWKLYRSRLQKELDGEAAKNPLLDYSLRAAANRRHVARFREMARKDGEAEASVAMDLPWDLRKNLVIRYRDILGPLPAYGTYEQLFVVQDEGGVYKPPDAEVVDIARRYWKNTLDDAVVKGVHPGHKTPADVMAKRVELLYKSLAEANAAYQEAKAEQELKDGVDAGQIQVRQDKPRIYVPASYGLNQ